MKDGFLAAARENLTPGFSVKMFSAEDEAGRRLSSSLGYCKFPTIFSGVYFILVVDNRIDKVVIHAINTLFNQSVAVSFKAGKTRIEVAHKL